ncbi:MAG: type II toxin-antitoxin system tRNA(fMet)-specific endonuclease VapC [Planctomycetota bacterium]|jgi:tRNA(fMet)-specific endonuclease VapC
MKYMLDTNICIYIIKKHPLKVIKTLQKKKVGNICISAITLAELEYGVEKSNRKLQNQLALTEFLAPIEILDFDDSAAKYFGIIRTQLENKGKVIGPFDIQIAAHALSKNQILVTNNVKEFSRIPELKIENWVK